MRTEAAALGVGDEVAPGLFVGPRPFRSGRAAFGVGGGRLLAAGRPASLVAACEGRRRVKVPAGPWKRSGSPTELLKQIPADLVPARRREAELELYPTAGDWLLVEPAPWPPHFVAPDLPVRTSTSLPSQLARAVVNLVAHPGDRVLDPVCGTGVLLIEALRIGCQGVGRDRNPKALAGARRNLEALGLTARRERRDALEADDEPLDVVVGDLPYGRRLEPTDLGPLARAVRQRGRRWALVAHVDLSEELGEGLRQVIEVPKPTFSRFVHLGGEPLAVA